MSQSSSSLGHSVYALTEETRVKLERLRKAGAKVYHYTPLKCDANCSQSFSGSSGHFKAGQTIWMFEGDTLDNLPDRNFHHQCRAVTMAFNAGFQFTLPMESGRHFDLIGLNGYHEGKRVIVDLPDVLSWEVEKSLPPPFDAEQPAGGNSLEGLLGGGDQEAWLLRVPIPTSLGRASRNLMSHLTSENIEWALQWLDRHAPGGPRANLRCGWSLDNDHPTHWPMRDLSDTEVPREVWGVIPFSPFQIPEDGLPPSIVTVDELKRSYRLDGMTALETLFNEGHSRRSQVRLRGTESSSDQLPRYDLVSAREEGSGDQAGDIVFCSFHTDQSALESAMSRQA